MRLQQFQIQLVEKTRRHLPRALKDFEPRAFFTLVKVFYRQPKLHYEVWVRGKDRLIEVGLHLEADPATNDALLAYFESRAVEIHAALGARVEIERWTHTWCRVHEIVPYETLDTALAETVAKKLTRMITILQPMLEATDEYARGH